VVGVEECEVAVLGAEFGQDAIFVLTSASRRVVSCAGNRELSTGWSADCERFNDPSKAATLEEPCVYGIQGRRPGNLSYLSTHQRAARPGPQLGRATLLLRIRR
jgi:hypothetical protein